MNEYTIPTSLLGSELTTIVDPFGTPAPLRRVWAGRHLMILAGGPSALTHLQKIQQHRPLLMTINNMWSKIEPDAWVCVDRPERFHVDGWRSPRIMKFCPTANANARLLKSSEKRETLAETPASSPNAWFYRYGVGFDKNAFFKRSSICIGNKGGDLGADGLAGARSSMLAAVRIAHMLGAAGIHIVGMDLKMTAEEPYAFKAFKSAPKENYVKHWNKQAKALGTRMASLVPIAEKLDMPMRMVGEGPLPSCSIDEALEKCSVSSPVGADVAGMYGWEQTDGATK